MAWVLIKVLKLTKEHPTSTQVYLGKGLMSACNFQFSIFDLNFSILFENASI